MRKDLFSLREEESLKAEKDAISSVKSQIHEPAMELLAAKKVESSPNIENTQDFSSEPFMQETSKSNTNEKVRVRTLEGPTPMMHNPAPVEEDNYRPMNNMGSGMESSDEINNTSNESSWFNQYNQMGAGTLNTLIIIGFVVLVVLVVLVTFTVLHGIGY